MGNSETKTQTAPERHEFSFAVLGQTMPQSPEHEVQLQEHKEAHWTARKACAVLKVTSSIINALVVHPGAESDEAALSSATTELMARAARLTDSAIELLGIKSDIRNFAGHKNLLRQQAADVVSVQWRMANSVGVKELSTEQIVALYDKVLKANPLETEGDTVSYPQGVDAVTAKRVSLLGVAPEIYQAVNSFDYFAPEPQALVQKGIKAVVRVADHGVQRLVHESASEDTVTMVTQSLIGKMGALYASNYRAAARKDVTALRNMDQDERMRHIFVHRVAGLPTDHIDTSFIRFANRMIDMVCDAVPELAQSPSLEKRVVTTPPALSAVTAGQQPE